MHSPPVCSAPGLLPALGRGGLGAAPIFTFELSLWPPGRAACSGQSSCPGLGFTSPGLRCPGTALLLTQPEEVPTGSGPRAGRAQAQPEAFPDKRRRDQGPQPVGLKELHTHDGPAVTCVLPIPSSSCLHPTLLFRPPQRWPLPWQWPLN